MVAKLKALWASVPPYAKTMIVLFVGSASGVLHHAIQNPNACMTYSCWKGYFFSALHAGGITVFAYLMDSPFAKQFIVTVPSNQTTVIASLPVDAPKP